MRPRLPLVRRTVAWTSQYPPSPLISTSSLRTFAQTASDRPTPRMRPQNPYLSVATTSRRGTQVVRFMTTERKAKLKYELKHGLKVTIYIWLGVGVVMACGFVLDQEALEKQFPTPAEWSFMTRRAFRNACRERYQTPPDKPVQWGKVVQWMVWCLGGLHNPQGDGKGLKDGPPGSPEKTKDISAMSEPWRRGYFEAMMILLKALEQTDGWMRDKTRGMIFPPEMVIGPSNPNPQPIWPGLKGAPKEEDCELAFPSPNEIYLNIINTPGLNNRQRIEAGLAYANWLDFKGMTGPAGIVFKDTLNLAISEGQSRVIDPETLTIKEDSGLPSSNLITTLTALAEFRARSGDISAALPMFVSLLKARRSLPQPDSRAYRRNPDKGVWGMIRGLLIPAAYPAPPPDGTAPPVRDAKELCEEAALSLHIGEIIYTSQTANREEGLGWTREAVDIAEEQLHEIDTSEASKPVRATCRECLATGLSNWQTMVARLAREEAAKKEEAEAAAAGKTSSSSWFGLWGGDGKAKKEDLSRWAAEEKVIQERQRRAHELLEELEPPQRTGWAALLTV